MKKNILFSDNARTKLKEGVDILAKAVGSTLGPKGRNVVIESAYAAPHVTKDGVTVANAVVLEDPEKNLGAQLVKQAAAKTVSEAGDGTTTATILAQAMISEGHKLIQAGASPIDIKRGMESYAEKIITHLKNASEEVGDSWDKIQQIATISANNDKEIGSLIREAFEAVGKEGVVAVQESKSTETYVTVTKGVQFDRGYISPYFINNDKMQCELENPYILIHDSKIRGTHDIIQILEKAVAKRKPLLIIAEEVEAQALSLLIVNKMKAGIPVCAVKAPAFGDRRRKVLEDLAIITGGKVISESVGRTLSSVELSDLGRCKKIIISKNETTIIDGAGKEEAINRRADEIRQEIEKGDSKWVQNKDKERLAKLVGGVAMLNVGAHTEIELKEKKDRIDDALHATQAAIAEGVSVGGGIAYINAIYNSSIPAEQMGEKVVKKALLAPFSKIIENAGGSPDAVFANLIFNENNTHGYNAATGEYEDLMESGVIDPTKVLRVALENAVSAASMVLMTEVSITEKSEMPEDQYNDIDTSQLF